MRFVVLGAGAVGGVVGGRLAQSGAEVVLVARGPHLAAIQRDGLRLDDPDGSATLPIPAVAGPAEVDWSPDDVVLLAVKGQDTASVLDVLRDVAPPEVPVCCLQNGVENERLALRLFAHVYGVCVMLPASSLEPGVVQADSAPVTGLLDVGRYPEGIDDVAEAVAAAFADATFDARALPDVMRWKYAKLLRNLGNAVPVVCEPGEGEELTARARREALACFAAAGIEAASAEEERARRGDLLDVRPVAGRERPGSSTMQSILRGTGSVETDVLNGEIVLLGRLHGVATPVNALLQRTAREVALGARPASATSEAALLAEVEAQG